MGPDEGDGARCRCHSRGGRTAAASRLPIAYLGTFGVLLAVIGVLGTFTATLENELYRAAYDLGWFQSQSGYFDGSPAIITGAAGLLLLAGGLAAVRRERRLAA